MKEKNEKSTKKLDCRRTYYLGYDNGKFLGQKVLRQGQIRPSDALEIAPLLFFAHKLKRYHGFDDSIVSNSCVVQFQLIKSWLASYKKGLKRGFEKSFKEIYGYTREFRI